MKNTKQIIFDANILDKIASSRKMGEIEKLSFLKYIGYITKRERFELLKLI